MRFLIGLACGSPIPYPSFNGLPAPCIPNIVILDVDAETSSAHDSEDPGKSVIFSQIRSVEYTNGQLSREEADQCVAELQAIVDDFERSTKEPMNLDLSGVLSDSDNNSSLGVSLDTPHEHTRLVRKTRHSQSLDSVKNCTHDSLSLFKPSALSRENVTRLKSSDGKVAMLTNYFASLGSAGLVQFPADEAPQRSASEPSIASTLPMNAETQTSPRVLISSETGTQTSARLVLEAQVQTIQPDYDYRLIYSLLKNDKKKKFPRDYVRCKKRGKWHSAEHVHVYPVGEIEKSRSVDFSDLGDGLNGLQKPRLRSAVALSSKLCCRFRVL